MHILYPDLDLYHIWIWIENMENIWKIYGKCMENIWTLWK
jgi:hypothetical protein